MLSISSNSSDSQLPVLVVDTQKRDGMNMARMTKAQVKRALQDIDKKTKKIYTQFPLVSSYKMPIRATDMIAIEKIIKAALKRLGY
jgi:hypothetical protein